MFNIFFSLINIYFLLPIVFIIIIIKSSIKLNEKTLVFIIISIVSIIVGVLMAPLEYNSIGELYNHYIVKIQNYEIPLITHIESAMPLTHAVSVLFYDITKIDLVIFFNLFRMFLYFFYLYGIYLIYSLLIQNISLKSKNTFILLIFLIMMDYNGTHLFTGDQFRNFLGQVFFIYFIYYFFLKKQLFSFNSILFIVAAILSHKLYLLLIPFFLTSYYLYIKMKLYSYFYLTILVACLGVFSVGIMQELSIYINFLSIANKLNNHNVLVGLNLIFSPGVIGQLLFHIVVIYFFIQAQKKFISNKNLMFLLFLTILMLSVARINFFGIQFVGPSRIYGIMAPFIFILLTISLYDYMNTKKNSIFPQLFIFLYFIFSFLLVNFSKETFSPHLLLIKQNIFTLDKYFGTNLILILYISIFFVLLIFIDFIINKILKMNIDTILLVWKYFTVSSLILLITLLINHSFDVYFYLLLISLIIVFIMGKMLLTVLPRKKIRS